MIKRVFIIFMILCVFSASFNTYVASATSEELDDTTPPVITVTNGNPASSTPPPYSVTFTVSDDSGLSSVTVNGRNVGASGIKYNVSWAVTTNCVLSIVAIDIHGNSASTNITITNIGTDSTTQTPGTEDLTTAEETPVTETTEEREPAATTQTTEASGPAATTEEIIVWAPATTEENTTSEDDSAADSNNKDRDKNKSNEDAPESDKSTGKENDSTNKSNKEIQQETIDGKTVKDSGQTDFKWKIVISAIFVIMLCLAGLLVYVIMSISEKEKQKLNEEMDNQEQNNSNTEYPQDVQGPQGPQIGGNMFKKR